jgi:hypothetical protein
MESTASISRYTYHDHDGQSPHASGIDELCTAVCWIDAPGEHVGAECEDELRLSQLRVTPGAGDTHKLRDDRIRAMSVVSRGAQCRYDVHALRILGAVVGKDEAHCARDDRVRAEHHHECECANASRVPLHIGDRWLLGSTVA